VAVFNLPIGIANWKVIETKKKYTKNLKKMIRIKILAALSLFTFVTCQKPVLQQKTEEPPDLTKNVQHINQMKVPVGFNYETTKNIEITVNVADQTFGEKNHLILIYNGNPDNGGSLITSGSANINMPFVAKFSLESYINEIYVARFNPNGERIVESVPAVSGQININMLRKAQFLGKKNGPDCNTGCTNTINNQTNQNINVSNGVTCITGNFSGNINLSGTAVVRICGTATIGNCNINSNTAQLIFTSTAIVSFNSSFSTGGTVTNYGTLNISQNLNVNSNSIFINEGTLTAGQSVNVNGQTTFTNNGTISCGNFQNNSGSNTTNNCRINTSNNFINNGNFTNTGFINCQGELTIQGGSNQNFTQSNAAMILTNDIQINANINGTSNTSFIKVNNRTRINSQGSVTGSQQFCDLNGIEQNNGIIGSGATIGCSAVIPITQCNPVGNNAIVDTDGDGVADIADAYPNDNQRAYNNFYPNANSFATVSFEDLWPHKGDYDVNDVVVDFRHNVVTNAQNRVVDIRSTYIYRAHGGSQTTGFAIEFPTALSNINTASLTVTVSPSQNPGVLQQVLFESGTSNATMRLFSNSYIMPNWNTVIGDARSDTLIYNVTFSFTNNFTQATTLAAFGGVNEFNPFIWDVAPNKGRGYEIHLPGKNWTSQANTAVFGIADDNTNPSGNGVKYKTKDNLPYAILTPSRFEYPVEVKIFPVPQQNPPIDITQIYLHFAQWSQSGGTLYPDWYSNKSTGYRTTQPWIYTY
jgi:LruC domain-containing protein